MIALALTLVLAGSDGGPPSQELQKVLGGDFRTVTTVRVLGVKGEGINLDQLSKVLEGQSHPLSRCYEERLTANKAVAGTVRLAFTLTTNGRVKDPKIGLNLENLTRDGSALMTDCLQGVVRMWLIPLFPPTPTQIETELSWERLPGKPFEYYDPNPAPSRPPPRAAKGQVTASIANLDGSGVSREELETFVRSRTRAILGCYEKALPLHPTLKENVVLSFVITELGRSADSGANTDSAVATCVKTVVRGWVFPFKPAARTRVSIAWVFSPAGDP